MEKYLLFGSITAMLLTVGAGCATNNNDHCCSSNDQCAPTAAEDLRSCPMDKCQCVSVQPITVSIVGDWRDPTLGQENYSIELKAEGGLAPYTWKLAISDERLNWLELKVDNSDSKKSKAWLKNKAGWSPVAKTEALAIEVTVNDHTKPGKDMERVDNLGGKFVHSIAISDFPQNCISGDGSCPTGCNIDNDSDCPIICGDGVVSSTETCDIGINAGQAGACPTSCDDDVNCTTNTTKTLYNAGTCQAACLDSKTTACISTKFGYVSGYVQNDALIWKGIHYAKPPVGALRWKAPVDPDTWTGVQHATIPCSECSQQVTDKFWRPSSGFTGSEDCLCLDIYRPNSDTKGLPVFVWIHGGANVLGSAQGFNGIALAKRGNMIVVIIQYRLDTLGWLTHPALRDSGTAQDKSGNYGTLDTMKALAWVNNNIDAFGGDSANVTVGGQSAGGAHVMNLIISPMTNNFQKAFAESPALSELMPLRTLNEGDTETNSIIDALLVKDGKATDAAAAATCRANMSNTQIEDYLRGKSAEQILQATIAGPGFGLLMPPPTGFMDGTVLPEKSWADTINAGNFKKFPLIIGNTQYEFKDLMTLYGLALKFFLNPPVPSGTYSWINLYDVLNGSIKLDKVLPTENDRLEYEQTGLLKSRKWRAESNAIARAIKTNNPANTVYSYFFTWTGGGDHALDDFSFIFGAAHSQDIPFFFGDDTDVFKGYSFTEANKAGRVALQGAMMDYLASYVKTGDPNPSGSALPTWLQWSNSNTANEPKSINFDADLNSFQVVMDSTETTKDNVYNEIQAVVTAHPDFKNLFGFLGIQIWPY